MLRIRRRKWKMSEGVLYSSTNENLEGLIAGLDVKPEDIILAVGGCGDQAFALLEIAGRVIVADSNSSQIELIRKRAKLLQDEDYQRFLNVEEVGSADGCFSGEHMPQMIQANKKRRYIYFSSEGRLEMIRKNLGNLEIREPVDIIEVSKSTEHNKIYLSNILGFGELFCDVTVLKDIAQHLPQNGLVYVANHNDLCERRADVLYKKLTGQKKEYLRKMEDWFAIPKPDFLPPELILDMDFTRRARMDERFWDPGVYRKILLGSTRMIGAIEQLWERG
jgi:hypothetical protein